MAIEKKFVREQINRLLIKEFVAKETERAGFGGLDIQRTPMGTRVSLIVERPGMVIGRRGATIQQLTSDIASKFDAENPQIEVIEAGRDANLNANIMARKVAEALERGWHFRRAGHSTVRRIMESGAKGCIVILSGKLTGQRHRVQKFIDGHIKYNGDTALNLMDVGYSQCKRKLGVIGCTVKIMHPDARLPDEVRIFAPGEKELLAQAARRPERREPVSEQVEERPAAPATEAAPAGERREEEKPRGRSRRREPAPQPTEADIREAEELEKRRIAEREAKKAASAEAAASPAQATSGVTAAATREPRTPEVEPEVAVATEPSGGKLPDVEAAPAETAAPAPAAEAKAEAPKAKAEAKPKKAEEAVEAKPETTEATETEAKPKKAEETDGGEA